MIQRGRGVGVGKEQVHLAIVVEIRPGHTGGSGQVRHPGDGAYILPLRLDDREGGRQGVRLTVGVGHGHVPRAWGGIGGHGGLDAQLGLIHESDGLDGDVRAERDGRQFDEAGPENGEVAGAALGDCRWGDAGHLRRRWGDQGDLEGARQGGTLAVVVAHGHVP